ncbi:hypothetical protein L861_16130 [Litchfieldella anticariensis FP35 = DSM 16096]|uniref:Uncharacterized protein n=1 Tax=Litchfieldella anticariensis (strain DSM 16096 / CECT 5854 / CIP 108499 / LMG 22089 / FP35) TaxID=1121939 RepID=S2LBW7_LITA3|nr:hypothetical protein [Halomonas anticariensis]EPC02236.1 hypothetical protein L861_16130 [Halomonas anticariensis FP35 = DSM 16096]
MMISQQLLKRIGVIGVSFGLIASPLALGQDDPTVQSTDSAANPEEGGELVDQQESQSEELRDEEVEPSVKSTDSAANPEAEGELAEEGQSSGEEWLEEDDEELESSTESTGSAANPAEEGDLADEDE